MRLEPLLTLLLVAPFLTGAAAPRDIASYRIDATLDTTNNTVNGTAALDWVNSTTHPASELQFHLYMNAFKGPHTTFAKGSPPAEEDFTEWGSTDILKASIGGRAVSIEPIAPDDGNEADATVVRAPLPVPIPAGTSAHIDIAFRTRLPRCISRAGYTGDFYMLAQWYPKIGVYRPDGTWNCHQYNRFGEFFADFGDYDVTLRLPSSFSIVATGVEVARDAHNTTQVVTFRAEDVTDVAIAAQPGATILRSSWRSRRGHTVALALMMQPEHVRYAARHLEATTEALDFLEDWCGEYPHPAVAIVDPPWNAIEAAGGMEYPMLFVTATPLWEIQNSLSSIEATTVHEAAHLYFPHVVASDEVEEPWLDEGVVSYLTGTILDTRFGPSLPDVRMLGIPVAQLLPLPRSFDWETSKLSWLEQPGEDAASRASWQYKTATAYYNQVYSRTELVLRGLERVIGLAAMKHGFRLYTSRHAFGHPRAEDFYAALSDASGTDVRPYFAAFEDRAKPPDIAIDRVETWQDSPTAERRSRVIVSRRSGPAYPIEIEVTFEGGSVRRRSWDGRRRSAAIDFDGEVVRARIDPDRRIMLDIDETNNTWVRIPERRFAWKWTEMLAGLIQLVVSP